MSVKQVFGLMTSLEQVQKTLSQLTAFVVCRAIWDSDATLNETGFDRLGTACEDACTVAHNRLW